MASYFEGKKELFEGLAIGSLEKEWTQYPVLRVNFAGSYFYKKESISFHFNRMLGEWEEQYDLKRKKKKNYAKRFANVIETVLQQTGQPVVVLIDKYDKPVLDAENDDEVQEYNRALLRSFYRALEGMDEHLHFVFITGITEFIYMSILDGFTNLKDISIAPEYNTLCGFTDRDLHEHKELIKGVK